MIYLLAAVALLVVSLLAMVAWYKRKAAFQEQRADDAERSVKQTVKTQEAVSTIEKKHIEEDKISEAKIAVNDRSGLDSSW